MDSGCKIKDYALESLTEDEFCSKIYGVDAVIAGGECWTEKIFQAATILKIVARTGTGVDCVNLAAASRYGIWVTNTPNATIHAVADFTFALILCLLRNIPEMVQEMKSGKWQRFRGRELGSLTLGIIGVGSIGREVIKRTRGFGAGIIAFDVVPDIKFATEWQIQYVPLDELMARSDVVSLHCPLNEQTRGLINKQRLKMMKKDSYLVNTSRAAVVDKENLTAILKAREIAGAAIDVHDPAPCPPDDPLVLLDNVIATPWTAYNTEEAVSRMCITAATDVITVLHGGVPQFAVNKPENSPLLPPNEDK